MKVSGDIRLKEFKVISRQEKEGMKRTGVITLVSTINQYDAENMYGVSFKSMIFDHVGRDGRLPFSSIKVKSVTEKHKLNILGFEVDVTPDSPQIKALDDDELNKVDVVLKIPFDSDDYYGFASELCIHVGDDLKIELKPSQLELPLEE